MPIHRLQTALVALVALLLLCGAASAAPSIASVSPAVASQGGTRVQIEGAALNGSVVVVWFGSTPVLPVSFNYSTVLFDAPANDVDPVCVSVNVTAFAYNTWSTSNCVLVSFAAPTVTGVTGCVGSSPTIDCPALPTITVQGANFGSSDTGLSVDVGGLACTSVTLTTPHTTLTCDVAVPPTKPRQGLGVVVTKRVQQSASQPWVSFKGAA